jgi:hypothetical protein
VVDTYSLAQLRAWDLQTYFGHMNMGYFVSLPYTPG